MSQLKPWRRIDRQTLVSDRWLRLHADTCETAEGAQISPYYVVETSDWVLVAAITRAEELVLVRQYRHPIGQVTLEPPAGEVDRGESALAAAPRELLEETGYAGDPPRLVHAWSTNPARLSNSFQVVVIESAERVAAAQDAPEEQTEVVLWPLADAARLFLNPEFAHAPAAAGLVSALVATGRCRFG